MYKVEAGILLCKIDTKESNEEFSEWIPARAGIELDVITSFYEIEKNMTKIITCDGDIFCVHITFDIFSELFIKHRNTYRKVFN